MPETSQQEPEQPGRTEIALGRVVEEHGSRIAEQPLRVRALLSDALGAGARDERSAIDALVIAAEEGVAADLGRRRRGEGTATDDELLARLESRGLSSETATAAVSGWAIALGASTSIPATTSAPRRSAPESTGRLSPEDDPWRTDLPETSVEADAAPPDVESPVSPRSESTGTDRTTVAAGEERRRWSWTWVAAVVAVLAVGGGLWLVLRPDPAGDQVAVPDVVGREVSAAKAAVQETGLVWGTTVDAADDSVPDGAVISTDPAAATPADEGTIVVATISTGPAAVVVPDVTGKTEQEAVSSLTDAGLTVNPVRSIADTPLYPQGQVAKTDPVAGVSVASGAEIDLWVSTGNVEVPDVRGMRRQEALDVLNATALAGKTLEVPSDQPPGTVIDQVEAPGTLVRQGRTINVMVASAG
ncbi:PASTA domain-containing protein [Cellulomonas sp. URHD0024]|uniref:PASTA domain-containing protein n=1 Tax=Cellulomonas sp. URHD0024 TaxID=1302620 RepID=UPI0004289176|nr:PASTA domain-containing protein [Cellulomonas sp. URHD0024]